MARIDELPADQKATLQLLLTQGKSYEELAGLLRLEPTAVRERALDALDALGPDTPAGLSAARQDEISDYLLGQQSASERQRTREHLENSTAGRTWAREVAGELKAFNGAQLPEIPAESAEVDEAFDALTARRAARAGDERSSRLGGILLLAGIGIAVAVLLVILLKPGGDDSDDSASSGTTAGQSAAADQSTGASGAQPQILAQANLLARDGSNAEAVAFVLRSGQNNVIGIRGANFAPFKGKNFFYAVWLRGDNAKPYRLGFVRDDVPASGQDKGALVTGADPSQIATNQGTTAQKSAAREFKTSLTSALNAIGDRYTQVLITRETQENPTSPGTTVVSGDFQAPATTGSSGSSGG